MIVEFAKGVLLFAQDPKLEVVYMQPRHEVRQSLCMYNRCEFKYMVRESLAWRTLVTASAISPIDAKLKGLSLLSLDGKSKIKELC